MKLYTEEQVKKIVEKSRETGLTAEYLILTTTAIELPSDEEIEKASNESSYVDGFYYGAKWVIEQIKQDEKL